jgi:serine/threonine protein kinase
MDDGLFQTVKLLGVGAFSTVDEIRHLVTNGRLARKVLKGRGHVKHLVRELGALKTLKHRHIIRLVDATFDDQVSILLLSPVAESNLAEYLAASAPG